MSKWIKSFQVFMLVTTFSVVASLLTMAQVKDKLADKAPEVKVDKTKKGTSWKTGKAFKKGLKPSSRLKLIRARQFKGMKKAIGQRSYVPAQMDMWGNDTYGDCVTAEEFFNQDAGGHFLPGTLAVSWATTGGFLDGADLTDVMDAMIKSGPVVGQQTYSIGPYTAVDYSTESVLQSAIDIGPVKIGIDSTALPSGAGNQQGWSAFGGTPQQYTNEDHCVSIAGYGSMQYLCQSLNVTAPAGAPANGYLLYTWSTIGIVDHAWIMSTCGESWSRSPMVVGAPPFTPTPVPPTPPVPGTLTIMSGVFTMSDGTTQTLTSGSPTGGITGVTGTTTVQDLINALNNNKRR